MAFRGPRKGIAALLGKPAAIGALDYISPEAGFATGFTLTSPAALFDELLARPRDAKDLARPKPSWASISGTTCWRRWAARSLSRWTVPRVPVPAWKLVAEVRDPNRLEFAIEKIVEAANRKASSKGQPAAQLTQEVVAGRTWYQLAAPRLGAAGEARYTYDRRLPDCRAHARRWRNRPSGTALPVTASRVRRRFAALLPRDRYADFSGMVYQNMGRTLGSIMQALGGAKGLDPAQQEGHGKRGRRIYRSPCW